MAKYIYELADWPNFYWQHNKIEKGLEEISFIHGNLIGRISSLGFDVKENYSLMSISNNIVNSSEIEGIKLDLEQVRSSVVKKLHPGYTDNIKSTQHVIGAVNLTIDALENFDKILTKERLFAWHKFLFTTDANNVYSVNAGCWRNNAVQVISGPIGKERVHFEGIAADRVDSEMTRFIDWFNNENGMPCYIKAVVAHFWFVTIHPFEDGNGRIARTLMEMVLANFEKSKFRFYDIAGQIKQERDLYYDNLEYMQQSDNLDITNLILYFFDSLRKVFNRSDREIDNVLRKTRFWNNISNISLNQRQHKLITKLLDGFEGNLTSAKWAAITKKSQDTASRDINELVEKGILIVSEAKGRSTNYKLCEWLFD